jgi:ferrous-iron efflux pump FieF
MDIKQKASLFAITSASILALSKFAVGLISGSMAVASSGLDSLLDVFMSGMNFFAIKKAAKPADIDHQYGHGKAADIAAVIQSFVIIFSGIAIFHSTGEKFLRKEVISYSVFDLGVMILSLAFSAVISTVLRRVGKKTGSTPLKADALHYTSDLYSNSAAIAAIVITYYTRITYFDYLFAIITGFIIIFSAIKILREGFLGLMDTRIPETVEKKIEDIIDKTPYPYAGYHKFRSRFSGNKKYVDFHLLICRKANIDESHKLASKVEHELENKIEAIDVVIHIEPCSFDCDLSDATCKITRNTASYE